jgi:predicted ATPase
MILWLLGYADQAQQWGQETLTLAQQLEHPPSLAYAQLFSALLTQFRRDAAATQAHINTLMTATTARDFVFRLGQGHLLQGWALAMQEDADAGITLIRQGFTMTEGMGLKLYRPYFLALLAEAYGQAGQPESGLTVLEEALTLVEATDERWWEAEVYRLKGELLLRLPHPDLPQATACVSQALNVARQQQARALELRTALSLTRLWQQQNQGDQARQLLTAVSRWFTEGFETPDLQEAQALLQDLEAEETV